MSLLAGVIAKSGTAAPADPSPGAAVTPLAVPSAIQTILRRCFQGAHGVGFTKEGKQHYAKTVGALSAPSLQRHLTGEQPFTTFISDDDPKVATLTTQLAVLDLDNKAGYAVRLSDEDLDALVTRLTGVLTERGLRPLVAISRSGTGRNLWLTWGRPQSRLGVHTVLLAAINAVGLTEGRGGGVGERQCEIYVKGPVALPGFGRDIPALADSDDVPEIEAPAAIVADVTTRNPDDRLRSALRAIPADDFDTWVRVGHALKAGLGAAGRALWIEWSRTSAKHRDTDAARWDKLHPRSLTLGTIYYLARKHGWSDPLLPCTEFGNRDRFCERNHEIVRWVTQMDRWLVHHEGRWRYSDEAAHLLAVQTIRSIRDEARATADPQLAQRLNAWAIQCQTLRATENTQKLARASLLIMPERLDSDTYLLGVRNGVLDLRTGQLIANDPTLYITKSFGCDYMPGAKCDRWLQFLAETFPPHMVDYLHKLFGYLLTGDTSERKLWLFQGEGDNGKSVLVGLLQSLFLDYAANVEPVTFTTRRDEGGATPDIARLLGARLAVLHELSDKMQLNLPLIKRATGGTDRMTARHLYGRPFEFRPQFKTLLVTNRFPRINEDDEAVWKRVQVVHFSRQVAKDNQDPKLLDKLMDEAAGILGWMLDGCLRWQREGLVAPEDVLRETAQYRKSQDLVTLWLEDSEDVVIDKDRVANASALYEKFRVWAEIEMGVRFVIEQRTFGRAL